MPERLHDRWTKRIIRDSKQADNRANRPFELAKFVDSEWLEEQQTLQQNLCHHCEGFMDWIKRNHRTGLTVERLDEKQPHHKSNCVLSCKRCNSKRLSRENSLLRKYFFRWYRNTFDVRQTLSNRRGSFA